MSLQRISIDLVEAVIQCCGKCYHYKSGLEALFVRCGVSRSVFKKYEQLEKFKIARAILTDLDEAGENGVRLQHRIVAEFAQMRTLPSADLKDPDGARQALETLKKLATLQNIVSSSEEQAIAKRTKSAAEVQEARARKFASLEAIKKEFSALATSTDSNQSRGYDFEKILGRLCELNEIEYHPPFKTGSEQTDGMILYKNHHYLLEARWRSSAPTLGDLREFREKVKAKFDGCRGIFFSMAGFRDEVVAEFKTNENPVLLVDGRDIAEIIEERVSLLDAIDVKLEYAAKTGSPFLKLYE